MKHFFSPLLLFVFDAQKTFKAFPQNDFFFSSDEKFSKTYRHPIPFRFRNEIYFPF
jgi:hypothetical protein